MRIDWLESGFLRYIFLRFAITSTWKCYRWKWGIPFLTEYWGLAPDNISRKRIFWDLHGRMRNFYLHGVTSLSFQSFISLNPVLEDLWQGDSVELEAKPESKVSVSCCWVQHSIHCVESSWYEPLQKGS